VPAATPSPFIDLDGLDTSVHEDMDAEDDEYEIAAEEVTRVCVLSWVPSWRCHRVSEESVSEEEQQMATPHPPAGVHPERKYVALVGGPRG
jgi:hypothetical protein